MAQNCSLIDIIREDWIVLPLPGANAEGNLNPGMGQMCSTLSGLWGGGSSLPRATPGVTEIAALRASRHYFEKICVRGDWWVHFIFSSCLLISFCQ
jgi:hypothetical protein